MGAEGRSAEHVRLAQLLHLLTATCQPLGRKVNEELEWKEQPLSSTTLWGGLKIRVLTNDFLGSA